MPKIDWFMYWAGAPVPRTGAVTSSWPSSEKRRRDGSWCEGIRFALLLRFRTFFSLGVERFAVGEDMLRSVVVLESRLRYVRLAVVAVFASHNRVLGPELQYNPNYHQHNLVLCEPRRVIG